jgi:hypothetical protein
MPMLLCFQRFNAFSQGFYAIFTPFGSLFLAQKALPHSSTVIIRLSNQVKRTQYDDFIISS